VSSSSCNNGAQELTAAVNNSPVDIVILTNGPGEIAAWVKPVVAAMQQQTNKHFSDIHILVVLAPCPHASGGEFQLLQTFDDIDRCQGPEGFWQLLLLGQSLRNWDWRKRGLCIFLGGDQFNVVLALDLILPNGIWSCSSQ
jgi:hypothetical protein